MSRPSPELQRRINEERKLLMRHQKSAGVPEPKLRPLALTISMINAAFPEWEKRRFGYATPQMSMRDVIQRSVK